MSPIKALEQHIAVFGESGSGKTVLVSSFYGAAQERQNIKKNGFHVVAENPSQGLHLNKNYLGMRDSAKTPVLTRFAATSYSFLIKLKPGTAVQSSKSTAFDALRLVWHDYPGEWFGEDLSTPELAQRRVETFRTLLGSDVALLVVDAQQLLDHAGDEQLYLKALLNNYQSQLLLLKNDLLVDGKPLVKFPRIWVMALSKSDLLPELTVDAFKDLLVGEVGDDLAELREVLSGLVAGNDALSVGEDFVLLSSAKFDPAKIHFEERVGLDLILPLASIVPFQRHMKWAESMNLPRKVALNLLQSAESIAIGLGLVGAFVAKLIASNNRALGVIAAMLSQVAPAVAKWALGKLTEADRTALAKQSSLAATLLGFEKILDENEAQEVLHLSRT